MELSKLRILYIDGIENQIFKDGFTLKDKKWPHMIIDYPANGYYEIAKEDGELMTLRPGEGCCIIPPNITNTCIHRLGPGDTVIRAHWIQFSVTYDDVLDVTSWFKPPFLVTGQQAEPFVRAVDALVALRDRENEQETVFKKLRIAATLLEELLKISTFEPVTIETERIYPAIQMIKTNYAQKLSVEELADRCSMSPSALHRSFRRIIGMTPMQYLQEYRLKQVAQQLLTGKRTLAQIAEQCGFCDEFHLSRNFKKQYAMSPREYKKRTGLR